MESKRVGRRRAPTLRTRFSVQARLRIERSRQLRGSDNDEVRKREYTSSKGCSSIQAASSVLDAKKTWFNAQERKRAVPPAHNWNLSALTDIVNPLAATHSKLWAAQEAVEGNNIESVMWYYQLVVHGGLACGQVEFLMNSARICADNLSTKSLR